MRLYAVGGIRFAQRGAAGKPDGWRGGRHAQPPPWCPRFEGRACASRLCRRLAERGVFWRNSDDGRTSETVLKILVSGPFLLAAGAGFEPATFGL